MAKARSNAVLREVAALGVNTKRADFQRSPLFLVEDRLYQRPIMPGPNWPVGAWLPSHIGQLPAPFPGP